MAVDASSRNADVPPDRLPPQDLEAEQACLGAMLIEAGATARAMSIVKEEDFYRDAHRVIFRAMLEVHNRTEPVDIVTVAAELRRQGKLEQVGGGEYLTAPINQVPTSAHGGRYATIVAETSVLRQLISAGSKIQGLGYANPQDVGEVLDQAEQSIF
ncbi:MAG: DnaB-like helicase N-terminal domain-containing protein, partial [Acidobacteriota bacterium]|nr:DnaB-like helicase N-terminal domain-containing protein [Acidobacteriota bacterium]